jgi:predicted ATPase/class 3 adenylate cyclase
MVTFLLTDIEASTRRWEADPRAMKLAIGRHDQLLATGVEDHGGTVLKERGEGDSLFAVFARTRDAVAAAASIQRSLSDEVWPRGLPIRVRIAIHTGEADEESAFDYRGAAVNRCARLRAVAHGGQILVSEAAHHVLVDTLPPGVDLKDLGMHRLKDLSRPENIYQLVHPDLPQDFPPLMSLDVRRTNLPIALSSFIGRTGEMAALKQLLGKTRLLTLVGAGGIGKTRLALQLAGELIDDFEHGAWLVDLASLSEPELVAQRVGSSLGIREQPGQAYAETLTEYLEAKRLLLVIDNCEHLVAAAAALADHLLKTCPHVRLLATSREVLRIPGELVWKVPGLAEDQALFMDRAHLAPTSSQPNGSDRELVERVCRQLDGIPLAIELAATKLSVLTLPELASRLAHRFTVLTGGNRAALPRQQTLQATIDWSYKLLPQPERALLRRLSVFAGGFTLEAAEAVCAGAGLQAGDVLAALGHLVEKSLVLAEDGGRFKLLETIREYSQAKCDQAGERRRLAEKHLRWFLSLAEAARSQWHGPEARAWLDRFEMEHDNFRGALHWAFATGSAEAPLQLAAALEWFWRSRSYVQEGRDWLERGMAACSKAPAPLRAAANFGLGCLALNQSDTPAARGYHEAAVAAYRSIDDWHGVAQTLPELAIVERLVGNFSTARGLCEEAIAIAERIGDHESLARSLFQLEIQARVQGEWERARVLCERGLSYFRQRGDRQGVAELVADLGVVARAQGDFQAAEACAEEGLALFQELGDRPGEASSYGLLGWIHQNLGELDQARQLMDKSLTVWRAHGEPMGIARTLWGLAGIVAAQGDADTAALLFRESLLTLRGKGPGDPRVLEALAAVERQRGRLQRAAVLLGCAASFRPLGGNPIPPADWPAHEALIQTLKAGLGPQEYESKRCVGESMAPDQVMAFALETQPGSG